MANTTYTPEQQQRHSALPEFSGRVGLVRIGLNNVDVTLNTLLSHSNRSTTPPKGIGGSVLGNLSDYKVEAPPPISQIGQTINDGTERFGEPTYANTQPGNMTEGSDAAPDVTKLGQLDPTAIAKYVASLYGDGN